MATHSSVLAWRIPGMGEPRGLPSMGVAQSQIRLKQLSSSNLFCVCPSQQAVQVQQGYKTTANHRKYHSPLDGHNSKDSEA